MRVSDEKLVKLAERAWIRMEDEDVVVTDAGHAALSETIMSNIIHIGDEIWVAARCITAPACGKTSKPKASR